MTLTPDSWLATAAFAAIALLFAAIAGSMLVNQRWAHPLPSAGRAPPDAAAADAVRVSVIVPARDEADGHRGHRSAASWRSAASRSR